MAANRCGVSFQGDGWNVLELHHGGSCSTPGINLIPQLHTFKWLSAVSILPPKTETARQTTPWSPVQGSGMAERDTGHCPPASSSAVGQAAVNVLQAEGSLHTGSSLEAAEDPEWRLF